MAPQILTTYADEAHGLQMPAGAICGYNEVVVDWGVLHPFSRVLIWHHFETEYVNSYSIEYFDGSNWLPVGGTHSLRTDLAVNTPSPIWSIPTENVFPTVVGSKVRYSWPTCAHMETVWLWEFEVFSGEPLPLGQYWATPRQPGCYGLMLTLDSGQTDTAYFELK